MGYQADKFRFLNAVTGGASDAGSQALNAVIYGGDRWVAPHEQQDQP